MAKKTPTIINVLFTDTNPEDIIPAKKGSWFFRSNKNFYVNYSEDMSGAWSLLPYRTVMLPRPNPNKLISYEHPTMLWRKEVDGYYDEFEELLPKKGWKFYSYEDVFFASSEIIRNFNWFFPVPISSADPVGVDGSRSYDEDFFYIKSSGLWYRTPISLYESDVVEGAEQPNLYSSAPFCVNPRSLPIPSSSYTVDSVEQGDQTYDENYFYIKSTNWKRSPIIVYTSGLMTLF